MKNAFAIVTLSGLLTACAVAPPQQLPSPPRSAEPLPAVESAEDQAAAAEAASDAVAAAAKAAEEAALPKVPLSSALLYQLLKSEFEIRNGHWQSAYGGLMALAKQTRDPRLASRATELALRSRAYKEAMASVTLWRELAPGSDEASHYHMGLAMMMGDFTHAEQVFAKRLRETPPESRGMVMAQVQEVFARAPDKAAAGAALERVLTPYADSHDAQALLAQNAHARGDSRQAVRHAERALALKPDSEVAVLALVQSTPDMAAGSALFAAFLDKNPGAREVRLMHARMLMVREDYAGARREFAVLLAQQPDHAEAHYSSGVAAMHLNDKAAAEKHMRRYLELAGQGDGDKSYQGTALLLLSQLADERGDPRAAMALLDQITEPAPALQLHAQMQRAAMQAKLGDVAGARKRLHEIVVDTPKQQARLVQAEAQIMLEAGQAEGAYGVLAQGARRFPADPDLLYDYALMAEKTGRLEQMETTLRTVIAQAPDKHDAYNALGYSLAERNVRLPEALALISKALAMAPDNPFILDSMGWVQYRLGNLAQAEDHLRRAYALRNDPDVAVHLGEVLWSRGQKDAAQQLWREARARDPNNGTLRSTLSRLQLSL